jgi:uncharacterized protein
MTAQIIVLCLAAFAAGFIDAIIGGGGLIQTPATFITLPKYPIAYLIGTTKIPSIFGTSIAAVQYSLKVNIRWKLLALMCSIAMVMAYIGSFTVAHMSNQFMKPVIFVVLIIVAVYTYTKKNFGIAHSNPVYKKNEILIAATFALVIGFYDGFIGPGAGSFLAIFFISVLGFDFLKASAHAKIVNVSTNFGSILFFGAKGLVLWHFAIPMAICNFLGSIVGSRLAILKGNKFIRYFFLLVITLTIIRFGYDIFLHR